MESLSEMVAEIHITALDLAATYGVFHGMNDAFARGKIELKKPSHAIAVIQNDLIRSIAFRLCALCEKSDRHYDANMSVVLKSLDDPTFCDRLIDRDQRWRAKVLRTSTYPDAASNIQTLKARWANLKK